LIPLIDLVRRSLLSVAIAALEDKAALPLRRTLTSTTCSIWSGAPPPAAPAAAAPGSASSSLSPRAEPPRAAVVLDPSRAEEVATGTSVTAVVDAFTREICGVYTCGIVPTPCLDRCVALAKTRALARVDAGV